MVCLGLLSYGQAPTWGGSPQNLNFYDITSQTQAYFDSTGLDTVAHSGYKNFKRWEYTFKNLAGSVSEPKSFRPANEAMYSLFTNPGLVCNGNSSFSNPWSFAGNNKITEVSCRRMETGSLFCDYTDK